MEGFGDDVLGLVLRRVSDSEDRRSCSEVDKQWAKIEGLTRRSLRVVEPDRLPDFLPRFPNLTAMEIDRRISDQNLELVAAMCPGLRSLNLNLRRKDWPLNSRCKDFSDDGLRAIARNCSSLRKISLKRRDQVRDAGVIALAGSADDLAVLDLSWCSKITDAALDALGRVRSLKELYLQGCSLVTNAGLIALATGSAGNTLKTLDLAECDQITDDGLLYMQQMSSLQELNLADCGPRITDNGGVAVSRVSSLRSLDLSWLINLSDETMAALAQNCRTLIALRLTGCESVTGEGLRAFADHGCLEMLRLARCSSICVDDVEQILLRCVSLKHLVLDSSLRGWMSPLAKEKLSLLYRVDWCEAGL